MSYGDLLQVDPVELQFPFELKKQISCSLQLSNKSDDHVAFKLPMQAQKDAPPDLQCNDKFLLQSIVVNPGASAKDIAPELFNKESGNHVEECKLRVFYVPPHRTPSPVCEGPKEGSDSSPNASVSDNGTVDASEYNPVKLLISRLSEEKNSAIQQNKKLQRELELMKQESNRSRGGIPRMYVIIVSLVGAILGYYLKRT